jgi:hypothetical protein
MEISAKKSTIKLNAEPPVANWWSERLHCWKSHELSPLKTHWAHLPFSVHDYHSKMQMDRTTSSIHIAQSWHDRHSVPTIRSWGHNIEW